MFILLCILLYCSGSLYRFCQKISSLFIYYHQSTPLGVCKIWFLGKKVAKNAISSPFSCLAVFYDPPYINTLFMIFPKNSTSCNYTPYIRVTRVMVCVRLGSLIRKPNHRLNVRVLLFNTSTTSIVLVTFFCVTLYSLYTPYTRRLSKKKKIFNLCHC